MARRQKPNTDLQNVLDQVLQSNGSQTYKTSEWTRLCKAFLFHLNYHPEKVREALELPEEYDRGDPRSAREPSYRPLPADLVLFCVEALEAWDQEPLIQTQIAMWQRSLAALRNTPSGAEIRNALQQIDPELVPDNAKGAGRYGVDQSLADRFALLEPAVTELHKLYRQQLEAIPKLANLNRRQRIHRFYDKILRHHEPWRRILESLLSPSDTGDDRFDEQACSVLYEWLPAGRETPVIVCRRNLATLSGLSEQTVLNAFKRVSKRRKNSAC